MPAGTIFTEEIFTRTPPEPLHRSTSAVLVLALACALMPATRRGTGFHANRLDRVSPAAARHQVVGSRSRRGRRAAHHGRGGCAGAGVDVQSRPRQPAPRDDIANAFKYFGAAGGRGPGHRRDHPRRAHREEAGRSSTAASGRRLGGPGQRGDAGLQVLARARAALRHERCVGLPAVQRQHLDVVGAHRDWPSPSRRRCRRKSTAPGPRSACTPSPPAPAWSRVYDNQHWVSDVVVGAAVGIASAKLATGRWTIFGLRAPVPLATPNGLGLMWHGTF